MMKYGKSNIILSYGDCVKNGRYTLFSSFEKVKNYRYKKNLVSFVLPEIGNGPCNIVVLSLPTETEIKIERPEVDIYDSSIKDVKILRNNIDLALSVLLKNSPLKSMAFIFDRKKEKNFKTEFEKKMLFEMKKGINCLLKNDFKNGVKKLSGLGFGLTPSGDDFLSGLVLSMSVKGEKDKAEEIFKNYRTQNIISYNNIKNHLMKKTDEKTKKFIYSLGLKNRNELISALKNVINKGHTSGSDFLSGFLLPLNNRVGCLGLIKDL